MDRTLSFLKQQKWTIGSIFLGLSALAALLYYKHNKPQHISSIHSQESQSKNGLEDQQVRNQSRSLFQRVDEGHSQVRLNQTEQKKCRQRLSVITKTKQHFQNQDDKSQFQNRAASIKTQDLQQQYQDLRCSITLQLMRVPAKLPCNHTFEHSVITEHLKQHGNCPLCKKPAQPQDLSSCQVTKQAIVEFKQKAKRKGSAWTEERADMDYSRQIEGNS